MSDSGTLVVADNGWELISTAEPDDPAAVERDRLIRRARHEQRAVGDCPVCGRRGVELAVYTRRPSGEEALACADEHACCHAFGATRAAS